MPATLRRRRGARGLPGSPLRDVAAHDGAVEAHLRHRVVRRSAAPAARSAPTAVTDTTRPPAADEPPVGSARVPACSTATAAASARQGSSAPPVAGGRPDSPGRRRRRSRPHPGAVPTRSDLGRADPRRSAAAARPSGASSNGSTTWVSGSPNRALNSTTRVPREVSASPTYSSPEYGVPRRRISASVGRITRSTTSSLRPGGAQGSGEYAPMPPVLGPVSPSPTRLKSCAGGSAHDRLAVAEREQRHLGAVEVLLDDDPPAGRGMGQCRGTVLGDDDALAGGQAVGLDDVRRAERVQRLRPPRRRSCRRAPPRSARRRRPSPPWRTPWSPPAGRRRRTGRSRRCPWRVRRRRHRRRAALGPDHDEVGRLLRRRGRPRPAAGRPSRSPRSSGRSCADRARCRGCRGRRGRRTPTDRPTQRRGRGRARAPRSR